MDSISRRRLCAALVATPVTALISEIQGQQVPGSTTPIRGASQEAETWLAECLPARLPASTLHLSRFVEPIYFLTEPLIWMPNPGQERFRKVEVPSGFVTDLASIPRVFWSLLRPDGEYVYPAIVHDYLYWVQSRSRAESDEIFKLGMQEFSINPATIEVIYRAVRLGGNASWSDNQRQRKLGEKRILVRVPDDPRTKWADWRKTAGALR
jgi:hypothetical protein